MLQICIFIEKNMDYSLLSEAPLFRGLSSIEIEEVFSQVPHRIKNFQAGALISQSGEPVNSLMVVISGVVKGEMIDYAGRVIKIEDIHAPGALASAFMFGDKNRFPVNVVAVTKGELLMIEKSDFLRLLTTSDVILVNFLDIISNRSQFLSEKIKFLNFKTIKGKLAQFILQKAGKDKLSVVLDLTQNDLADFFGVARPSVARALGDMEEKGYLEAKGKHIRIIDKQGLADLTID
jgi:CRP/FNR family transcriptional regulator, dissimilatory nitrate respiration regulator